VLVFKVMTAATALIFLTACQTMPEKSEQTPDSEAVIVAPEKEVPTKKEQATAIDSYVLYLLLTGEVALQRRQYEIALEAYLEAAKRANDPRVAEKAAQIGMYLDNLPKTEKAVNLWLDKDDKNFSARQIALSAALSNKNQALLLKHLNAILKNNPAAFEETLLQLERIAKSEAEIKFISQTLEALAKQHPKNAAVFLTQSLIAVRQNNIDQALQKIRQALALQPSWEKALNFEAELMIYSGKLAFKKKRFDEAIAWFDKVKQGELADEAAMAAVAVLIEKKDFTTAQTRLESLLAKEQDPKQKLQLVLMQAELQSLQKNYQQAFDILTHVLVETPNNKEVLYARALTAEKMGDLETMETDLQAIIAQAPDDARALNALGYALTEHTNRYDEAEKYLQKAVKLQPEDAMIADSYGWLQFKKGNLEAALNYLQTAYKKLPENEIAAHLAETLWELGKKQQAETLIKEALKKTPEDEILLEFKQRVLKQPANGLKQ
jgi:tetratricopeptide (TPR) repeat protein